MKHPIRTGLLAIALVLGTAGASLAATAYADGDVRVKEEPRRSSDTLGWLEDGQRVSVDGCRRGWCRVELRGPDGYVREDDLDFRRRSRDRDPGVEFCIGGGGPAGGGFGFGRFCIEN